MPEFEHNEWKSELANQLLINRKIEEIILESRESFQSLKDRDSLKNLYKRVFPNKLFNKIESKEIHELASNMICLYFEYDYNDMPLGGWELFYPRLKEHQVVLVFHSFWEFQLFSLFLVCTTLTSFAQS